MIRVRRYEAADKPAIDRLNARLEAGSVKDRVWPGDHTTPSEERGDPMSRQLWIAADGDEIRGGVWIHTHQFMLKGEVVRAAWLKYPVAESLINRDYGGIPAAMLVTAMRQHPDIMALGMGSPTAPIAQLLATLGWSITPVPFFVMPARPARLVKHIPQLKHSAALQGIASVVANSGLATLAASPLTMARSVKTRTLLRGVETNVVTQFGDWADRTWVDVRNRYGFIARRDAAMLNLFYRPDYPRLTRLRIRQNNVDIGWVCTSVAEPNSLAAQREFGELRVGLLADALGRPENASVLTAAGVNYLMDQGVDLIVTNRIHPSWRGALRFMGFIPRPTNFFFAYSKHMSKNIGDIIDSGVYINRGDCDGPP